MIVLGIDPGRSGGVVLTDGATVLYQQRADGPQGYHTHAPKQDPNEGAILDLFETLRAEYRRIDVVVLEAPAWHAATRMNAGTAGRLGIEHGAWRGVIAALGYPLHILRAAKWRKLAGITVPKGTCPKAATIAEVGRRLPGLDLTPGKVRKAHTGLADAGGMTLAGGG